MISILTAKTQDDQLIILTKTISRTELHRLRQTRYFFCPLCNEKLLLKIGSVKIPHFAHQHHSLCASLSEPESPKHLSGKHQLHSFFTSRKFSCQLEVYIQPIAQRADLLISDTYAVEYQCSPIPAEEVERRTAGYRKAGFTPCWISGTAAPVSEGVQALKLRVFEQAILKQQNCVLFFDPDRDMFCYASNLFYLGGNRWAGKVRSLPASQQIFPFARARPVNKEEFRQICLLFRSERDRLVRARKFGSRHLKDPFWRVIYKMRYNVEQLPPFLGVPIQYAEVFRMHAVLWQLLVIEGDFNEEFLVNSGRISIAAGDEETAKRVIKQYALAYQQLVDTDSEEDMAAFLFSQSCKTY
ncbi:competence protein CoiA [Planococcus lenghuensis]|uniref:Competence protein CoiA n=1 Tax=Planococcus lenghuensis TaxID=2213202 RepID=A0A1Q2L0C6_9BACL|nr:competence protein CoiA family protein [Planococcus lenghuensis]AQQ53910.1 hypothetical protein B0X71_12950 [Planococcus lenghuensis]